MELFMLTNAEAISAAKAQMTANGIEFGECVNLLEFPDGTLTLHFEKPVRVSVPEGWVLVASAPQIVIAIVNRHDGSVYL
jgi:hypothetical protein